MDSSITSRSALFPLLARSAALAGENLDRREQSPQWKEGKFVNPEPMKNDVFKAMSGFFSADPSAIPTGSLPLIHVDPKLFSQAPASGLRVTWFGHSSTLVEIDGSHFLLDPVWSERSSPVQWAGPKR